MTTGDGFIAFLSMLLGLWPFTVEYVTYLTRRIEAQKLLNLQLADLGTLRPALPPGNISHITDATRSTIERTTHRSLWQFALLGLPAPVGTALRPVIQAGYGHGWWRLTYLFWFDVLVLTAISVWAYRSENVLAEIIADDRPGEGRSSEALRVRSERRAQTFFRLRLAVIVLAFLPSLEAVAYAVRR